jgi:hypothetical protein
MLATAGVWKKKREDLKIKRTSLFEEYSKHPHDLHLAREIKTIDDEIAECTHKMEQERRSEGSDSRKHLRATESVGSTIKVRL